MLTQEYATAIWNKIAVAPSQWFRSSDGIRICAKAARLIRGKADNAEARAFISLCRVAMVA